mmetsp:Transcript_22503/g.47070  ORF Transcript_22503/g.47070 Transcript_22503/m.47070 type:complete len:289 (-) Transcript_22503:1491-2357(-)
MATAKNHNDEPNENEGDSGSNNNVPILALMGRFFPFDPENGIPFATSTLVIKESQNRNHAVDDGDGGTGLNVWDGALLLARYLEKKSQIVEGKRILELGGGCGLVGIAAAILGAKHVIITDLSYALPLMKENVLRNEFAFRKGNDEKGALVECIECDWFHPPLIRELFTHETASLNGNEHEESFPDIILVADCVWLSHLIYPLLKTLKLYARHPSTKVIITYQQRGKDAHEEFLSGMHVLFKNVVDVDTKESVGLVKPDVFHVFECCGVKHEAETHDDSVTKAKISPF